MTYMESKKLIYQKGKGLHMIISTLKRAINTLGYDITKYKNIKNRKDIYSDIQIKSAENIVDVDSLGNSSLSIPGMIAARSGQFLYTLCYFQTLAGDVVEIGSWQGRSTMFIAMAAKNSGNGKVFAIDHFHGTSGKEKYFRVDKDDLSDLKSNFITNMEELDLLDSINLLDMSSEKAAQHIDDGSVRFLFIDGEHTKEGVQKDIELFYPKLKKNSIIVFDDYSLKYTGVVEAVDSLISEKQFSRMMTYDRTLILKVE